MSGETMIERAGVLPCQRRRRRARDEPVEHHRDAFKARRQYSTRDGRKLTPANPAHDLQRIVEGRAVSHHRRLDHLCLSIDAHLIDTGPRSRPVGARTAIEATTDRRRGRGVADAHLADTQEVDTVGHLFHAERDRCQELRLAHRRGLGEIDGRLIQVERAYLKLGAHGLADLVDRGGAAGEIRHHLPRDLGREGRDTLCRYPMIAGEDKGFDDLAAGRVASLPSGHESGNTFETSQRTSGLGQLCITVARSRLCGAVGARQITDQVTQLVNRPGRFHRRFHCLRMVLARATRGKDYPITEA